MLCTELKEYNLKNMDLDFIKQHDFFKKGCLCFKNFKWNEGSIFEFKTILKEFITYNPINQRYECDFEINFEDAEINWSFIVEDIDFKKGCYFDGCHFNAFVKFLDVSFNGYVSFNDAMFQYGDVLFSNVIFNNKISLFNASFKEDMTNEHVKEYAKFDIKSLALQQREKEIIFDKILFTNELEINTIKFNKLTFKESVFKQFNNVGVNSCGDLNFLKCNFESILRKGTSEEIAYNCNVNFEHSFFVGKSDFSNTVFNDKVGFKNVKFEDVDFTKVNFGSDGQQKTIDFSQVQFCGNTYFNDIKLYAGDNIDFSNIVVKNLFEFISNDSFLYLTNTLNFKNLRVNSGASFKLYNINRQRCLVGSITFEGAGIEGIVDIRNVYINDMNFEKIIVSGVIHTYNIHIDSLCHRDTYVLLKHESIRCNDYIEALFWKKYEMMAYSQSLMCKDYSSDRKSCYKIKQKSILTEIFCPLSTFKILYYIFTKRGGEKVLLHLNKCSNDYGSNWVRGVCFTIWMSIVFIVFFL